MLVDLRKSSGRYGSAIKLVKIFIHQQMKRTHLVILSCFLGSLFLAAMPFNELSAQRRKKEKEAKTMFQTAEGWMPEIDVRADAAIVYGVNGNNYKANMPFEERVKSWRDRGYDVHFMTGIAWGVYQEYITGKWDGKWHIREGQVNMRGDSIWHDHLAPYMVPVQSFIDYMNEMHVKRVIDAGITHIYLEEPEFWARAGYEEAFKDEWQDYYQEPWRPQHESPENTYLSNKLKYHLYHEAVKQVSDFAKSYGQRVGKAVKVYIPTHSLINYSAWNIVSPEASLASLPGIDGYIAQVWTGTSREPTFYKGVEKERVFENAYLEYGSMLSMTAPTGRKMIFLTDPIEDRARDWSDYKQNYEATFTAKLLYPQTNNYEIMPWPERIYTRPYRVKGTNERVLIPKFYSTQMQVMINALNQMPLSKNTVNGSAGIGVLLANSLMFQRFPIHSSYEDPRLSNFYGLSFPLLKRGVPVETVHIENLYHPNTLRNIDVLLMTYSNMKPLSAEYHHQLEKWVKKGGILVYVGEDKDPYQTVKEWWNTGANHFDSPSEHLFGLFGIPPTDIRDGYNHSYGKGKVFIIRQDPKVFAMQADSDGQLFNIVKAAYEQDAKKGPLQTKNHFYLERGAYDIIAVMDEHENTEPYKHQGLVVDLFDPKLPVLTEKMVEPGNQAFLLNLGRIKPGKPQVIAAAARIYDEEHRKLQYSFVAKSPLNTENAMRVLLKQEPRAIAVTDHTGAAVTFISTWDEASRTVFLKFDNDPEGIKVTLDY